MRKQQIIFRGWHVLDKIGAVGGILAAAAAPCCFPLFAAVGAALGLSAFQSLRGSVDYAIQAMVILALIGDALAYRQHGRVAPLVLALLSAGIVFFAYHIHYRVALVYVGLFGLPVAAVWNIRAKRQRACCRKN